MLLELFRDAAPTVSPDPLLIGDGSPLAQIITVTLGGIAAIIAALAGFAGMRRRRAEGTAGEVIGGDAEDRPARLRERLSALENRLAVLEHGDFERRVSKLEERIDSGKVRLDDLEEQMQLRRAADVVLESDVRRPRRREG